MSEPEVVDAVPVLHEPAAVPATTASAGEVAVQAAALAGATFVAGAGFVALLKSRRARKSAVRLVRGRRRRADVVATRSFLVDVHLLDRR